MKVKLPERKSTRALNVCIDADLFLEIRRAIQDEKITYRQVVEFGLRVYLEALKGRKGNEYDDDNIKKSDAS